MNRPWFCFSDVTVEVVRHSRFSEVTYEVLVTWSKQSLPSSSGFHRCVTCRSDYARPGAGRGGLTARDKKAPVSGGLRGVTVDSMPRSWRDRGPVLIPAAWTRRRISDGVNYSLRLIPAALRTHAWFLGTWHPHPPNALLHHQASVLIVPFPCNNALAYLWVGGAKHHQRVH